MAMRPRTLRVVSTGVTRAALTKMNLILPGAVVATAFALESWLLAGIAAASYLVGVATDLGRPTFWRKVLHEVRRKPPALPVETDLLDLSARDLLGRIERARSDRIEVLDRVPPAFRERVDELLETVAELEEAALAAVRVTDRLGRYMLRHEARSAEEDRRRLETLAMKAPPHLRLEYGRAIAALHQRLAAIEETSSYRALVLAKLEAMVSTLEMLPWRLVHLEAAEATSAAVGAAGDRLEVDALVSELHNLAEGAASACPELAPPPAEAESGALAMRAVR